MPPLPSQLDHVSIKLKANVYFDGGVISHTIAGANQPRRTIGIIQPGEYHFETDAAEQMDIISGTCRVRFKGQSMWKTFVAGQTFTIEGKSSFDIAVDNDLAEYLCTFG